MLNTYSEYITESYILKMINESLEASTGFLSKLKKISNKNIIAKFLYKLFSEQYTHITSRFNMNTQFDQNFIDIVSDSDELISFYPDKKSIGVEDPFSIRGRGQVKVGRFVRALFSNKPLFKKMQDEGFIDAGYILNDKDIEDFVNLYKSTKEDTKIKFKLVDGSDIKKYYNQENYAYPEIGNLGSSCMKGNDCEKFFKIYIKNPEVCRLLIYINEDGKILGRALVWKMKESPCGAKYLMDRVYTNMDSDINKFRQYADENGWMYKWKMDSNMNNSFFFMYKNEFIFGKVLVKIRKGDFDEYPYLDTLKFLDEDKENISNNGFPNGYEMEDTSGELENCYMCQLVSPSGEEKCTYCVGKMDSIIESIIGPGKENPQFYLSVKKYLKRK